jgi:sigma-B regulation protein RsbU (phosphoserine phosphatase)
LGSKPPRIQPPLHPLPPTASATASLRQLLDSLSREQRRNQELLASLAFALRSFTNLNRFLELVPLVAARLMEAEGALLLPFHADGRLWREQFHGTPPERSRDLLRQLVGFNDTSLLASAGEAGLVARLDQVVAQHWGEGALVGTSVVARSLQRGRLYVFGPAGDSGWSDVQRRHGQLVALEGPPDQLPLRCNRQAARRGGSVIQVEYADQPAPAKCH